MLSRKRFPKSTVREGGDQRAPRIAALWSLNFAVTCGVGCGKEGRQQRDVPYQSLPLWVRHGAPVSSRRPLRADGRQGGARRRRPARLIGHIPLLAAFFSAT